MKLRFLSWIMLLAMLTSHATAQCPDTKIKTIPASVQQFGAQGCSVNSLRVGQFTITGRGQVCPLLAIDTPAHELEVYAGPEAGTKTRVTGTVNEWTYFFRCERIWYVIIPWGSTCVFDRKVLRNTLHRRTTVSC